MTGRGKKLREQMRADLQSTAPSVQRAPARLLREGAHTKRPPMSSGESGQRAGDPQVRLRRQGGGAADTRTRTGSWARSAAGNCPRVMGLLSVCDELYKTCTMQCQHNATTQPRTSIGAPATPGAPGNDMKLRRLTARSTHRGDKVAMASRRTAAHHRAAQTPVRWRASQLAPQHAGRTMQRGKRWRLSSLSAPCAIAHVQIVGLACFPPT